MRGGQRRLVRPRSSTHSSGRAHGLLLCLPCFLLHPSLPPSFSSQGWCQTSSTERARKANCSPSRESSTTSTGPCKGTEGTALGPGPGSPGAGIAGASGAVLTSVSSFIVSIFALLASDRSRRTGCTARGCCRYAETVCLLLPEGFIVISTLCFCCEPPAACWWCRVPAACF